MKGFILAGGEGTRLRPLTLEIPKPLLPVAKIPVLTYLVDLYLKYGVKDIKINIQKKHRPDFKKWKRLYFPNKKIRFVIEDKPSGTLTPINKAGTKWFSETLTVSNGDELKQFDLKRMEKWHKEKKALVTIGLVKVKDPKHYGSVKLKKDRIIKFAEKAGRPLSPYINAGIYMMNPKKLD
jgi:NDP-sugar pyrophosphorylase family protein